MSNEPTPKPMRQQVEEYITDLQDRIVSSFEKLDPSAPSFKRDSWQRPQGGSGRSCVFVTPPSSTSADASGIPTSPSHASASGTIDPGTHTVLEKAGVNISIVHGILPPPAIKQMRADHSSMPLPDRPDGLPFFAGGISLVVHPRNPHAPTVHANYRYFEISEPPDAGSATTATTATTTPKVLAWWFGGGADLTPSYLYEEDAVHFHKTLKSACDGHSEVFYPAFKEWCDRYFYIPHREESRGIGGIFFDDLNEGPHLKLPGEASLLPSSASKPRPRTQLDIFAFVRSVGDAFVPSYLPILSKRYSIPYTPHERRWQLLRRGRYVEFNLVYDRGTKFGLMTPGARIESILMSLPETARWEYMSELGSDYLAEGEAEKEVSREGRLVRCLKKPVDWVEFGVEKKLI